MCAHVARLTDADDVREFEAKRGVAADDGTRASRSSSKRSKRDKSTHRDNGSISDGGGEDEDDSRGEGRTGGKERVSARIASNVEIWHCKASSLETCV